MIFKLSSTHHRKPTAGNTLFHASSAHPRPLVHSIHYAQFLRLCRNCTEEEDFRSQANAHRERLLLRGYSCTNLRKAFNRALACTRNSLLYGQPRNKQSDTIKIVKRFLAHHQQLTDMSGLPQNYFSGGLPLLGIALQGAITDLICGPLQVLGEPFHVDTVHDTHGSRRAPHIDCLMDKSLYFAHMPTVVLGELYI